MYEVGTITYSIYKLEKGGQGAHAIFWRWGGLDDGACDPLLFQKGGGAFSQQQKKTLK